MSALPCAHIKLSPDALSIWYLLSKGKLSNEYSSLKPDSKQFDAQEDSENTLEAGAFYKNIKSLNRFPIYGLGMLNRIFLLT